MDKPDRCNDRAEEIAESIIEEIKQYFDTYRLPEHQQADYRLSAQKCIEHHLREARNEALEPLQKIVDEQAEDEGLWFVAMYASEGYLQQELRRLHAAIEALKTEAGK